MISSCLGKTYACFLSQRGEARGESGKKSGQFKGSWIVSGRATKFPMLVGEAGRDVLLLGRSRQWQNLDSSVTVVLFVTSGIVSSAHIFRSSPFRQLFSGLIYSLSTVLYALDVSLKQMLLLSLIFKLQQRVSLHRSLLFFYEQDCNVL